VPSERLQENASDIEAAETVVRHYCAAMNEWEVRRYYRGRVDAGQFVRQGDQHLVPGESVDQLNAQYAAIFARFVVPRSRAHSGSPTSYGPKGRFDGVPECSLTSRSVSRNRIEVVGQGGLFPDHLHKFVVLRTANGWRIDSVKWRSPALAIWKPGLL